MLQTGEGLATGFVGAFVRTGDRTLYVCELLLGGDRGHRSEGGNAGESKREVGREGF